MMTKAKPKFEGVPLIEIPQVIPYADFARGEFGKAVEEEYNARVREDYKDHPNLKGILVYDKKDNPPLINFIAEETIESYWNIFL